MPLVVRFLGLVAAAAMVSALRAIILPGNGCSRSIRSCNWYGWMQDRLMESGLFTEVILQVMPDPVEAKEVVWVPHVLKEFNADEMTLIIGHSSGAQACMRLLERNRLFGAVLVSACYTDLGMPSEAVSGYYSRPWRWDDIKSNAAVGLGFGIVQVHSSDDPFIPMDEAEFVHSHLDTDFYRYDDRSHFFTNEDVEELLDVIVKRVRTDRDEL